MGQFLSEIQEKYTKIVKSANLIGIEPIVCFHLPLLILAKTTDSQPLDSYCLTNSELNSDDVSLIFVLQVEESESESEVPSPYICNIESGWLHRRKLIRLSTKEYCVQFGTSINRILLFFK